MKALVAQAKRSEYYCRLPYVPLRFPHSRTSADSWIIQTEGVGTQPIDDLSPLGRTPAPLHHLITGDDDESDTTSSESGSSTDGEESDTEGDYDDAGAQLETSTDDEDEILVTAVEAPAEYFEFGLGKPIEQHASLEPETPEVPAIRIEADQRPPLPTYDSSASTLALAPTASTSSTSKRGLSLPGFMKRRDSSKSVVSLKESEGATSDFNTTDVDSAASATTEKRKRFGRKKKTAGVVDQVVASSGEAAASIAVPAAAKKKRKGRKQRRAEKTEAEDSGEKREKKRGKKLGRRRTRRDYTYADDGDILGLVQIEVKGAKDLPRFKNAIRMGYDMDPFAVISFGRKVFRTRCV